MIVKRALLPILASVLLSSPGWACVGKTLVIGSLPSPEGRLTAQVIAILIYERTGTTVKISDFQDPEALHTGLAVGDVDVAVEHTTRALARLNLDIAGDTQAAFRAVKAAYLEKLNLVWLPPLGPTDGGSGLAAPVARKDTLKKFPALSRLIAKTQGLLPGDVLASLARSGEPAKSARQFLREKKLI